MHWTVFFGVFLGFAASAALCRGEGADANTYVKQYYPLPVLVERVEIPSGMFIGLEVKEINQPLDVAAKNAADGSAEKAAAHLAHVIADNNLKGFTEAVDLAGPESVMPQMLAFHRTLFTDPAKLQLLRCFAVGASTVVALRLQENPKAPTLVWLFESKDGQQLMSGKDFGNPIVQFLAELVRANGNYLGSDIAPPTTHSVVLKELFGDTGQHSVGVYFNGYNLSETQEMPTEYKVAVSNFKEAAESLAKGDVDGYASRIGGDYSRKWFAEHISNKDRLAIMTGNYKQQGSPSYVIGGDPLKILVFARTDHHDLPNYVQLLSSNGGKDAGIVNLGEHSSIDVLLTFPGFEKAIAEQLDDVEKAGARH